MSCAVALLGMVACSNIAEDERFVKIEEEPDPTPVDTTAAHPLYPKNALIEDFTGQSCVNCPEAAELIHELQQEYGSDKIVAVGIYSGPFGAPKGNAESLVTDFGKSLWDQWFTNDTPQPIGKINRGDALTKDEWVGAVQSVRKEQTRMTIGVVPSLSGAELTVQVNVNDIKHTEGTLNVWLIENGIIGSQMFAGESRPRKDYEHNHVLRCSLCGNGEAITLGTEESVSKQYTVQLAENWVTANMEVITFVTTGEKGLVEQVVATKLVQEN